MVSIQAILTRKGVYFFYIKRGCRILLNRDRKVTTDIPNEACKIMVSELDDGSISRIYYVALIEWRQGALLAGR